MTEGRPGVGRAVLVVLLAIAIALLLIPALVAKLTAEDRTLTDWIGLVFLAVALLLLPVGVIRVLRQSREP